MPTLGGPYWKVDTKALRAHLLGLGLIEGSNKWSAVWYKKCLRMGKYVNA